MFDVRVLSFSSVICYLKRIKHSSLGQGHRVVFLGKTTNSQCLFKPSNIKWVLEIFGGKFMQQNMDTIKPEIDQHPIHQIKNTLSCCMLQKSRQALAMCASLPTAPASMGAQRGTRDFK